MTVKGVTPKQLVQYAFQPKERAEAKAAGLTQYFTGRPCLHGHIAARCTSSGGCVVCANQQEKKSRKKRLENNPDLYKIQYAQNKEKFRLQTAKYRAKNPDKVKLSAKKSRQNRRAKATAAERERQAAKIGATPKWLTNEHHKQIDAIYDMARKTTLNAGFKCHVDHIVPLKGKAVCGLHVPWNLRVVSQSYNSKKFNNLDESVLYKPSLSGGVLIHNSALPWNWSK